MDICRLCLQSESQNIPNPDDVLDILTKFLPSVNTCLKQNRSVFQLCETCLCNINTIKNVNNTLNKTEEKIEGLIKNSNVKKVDLIYLLETKNGIGTKTKNIYLCRICLQIIDVPKIFLYENGTNILRYDLIYSMFLFCNITLKCDISQQPVMCLQCWENIQVCYSFKKNYIETNNKIKAYLTQFNISKHDVNEEVLKEMSQYISTEIKDIIMEKGYSLRRHVKKEYVNGITQLKKESNLKAKCNVLPKCSKYNFTAGDDQYLLEFYSEATNKDSGVGTRPWKCVQEKWLNKFPDKPLKVTSIYHRLTTLLKRKPNVNIKKGAQKKKAGSNKAGLEIVNSFVGDTLIDSDRESDDSFVDEIAPASFMPNINSEPLIDEEVYIIEPKMEHFTDIPPSGTDSDSESLPLPLLERMDLLEVWKVDHHSVDSKRETFNQISQNETINVIEDKKSYHRINTKLEEFPETLYKCTICNFKTKYKYSANRHSDWHSNPHKKAFTCNKCNFLTSKQFLLKQHLTENHQDEEEYAELPVLIPYTINY